MATPSAPTLPARPTRARWWLIGGLVLVLALAGGFFGWRALTDQTPAARVAAQRAADALLNRTLTDGAFGATAGPNEIDDLNATLRGMGTLRPVIDVQDVQLDEQQRRGSARWRAEWTIHAGKPAWVQEAYVQLFRGTEGWTAVWNRDLIASGLKAADRLRAVRLAPVRGEIIGADDERLVWNQEANRIGLDKTLIAAELQQASAKALARVVGIDADAFVTKVAANGPKAFVEAAVIRTVGDAEWTVVRRARAVPGVRVLDATRPLALSRTFARSLLGSVGEATGELIKASGGSVRDGDLVGLGGLQKARNATLMGVTGFVVQAYPDGRSEEARELFRVSAVPGSPLRITLDAALQRDAERLIGSGGSRALVAIRPSDGALLALASAPGTTTALSRRIYPGTFAPVSQIAETRPGGLANAVEALGLTGDAGIGVPVFLSATDGDTLRLSTYALASAAASVGRGASIRPNVFAEAEFPEVGDGITSDEAEAARLVMRTAVESGPLRSLDDLPGAKVLAAGDARLWTVALHGDLAVAVYDPDGTRSAALLESFLRRVG